MNGVHGANGLHGVVHGLNGLNGLNGRCGLFWACCWLFVILSAISCTNEEKVEVGGQKEVIAMQAYVAKTLTPRHVKTMQTRANAALLAEQGIPDGQSFGVYAVYHSNSTWAEEYQHYYDLDPSGKTALNTSFLPNFMKNQQVTYDALNDAYIYSPLKYWPNTPTDHVSFMAYYPYSDGGTDDVNALGVTPGWIDGLPYFHVTMKTAAAEQVDFLVSDFLADLSKPNIYDRVHFLFHHAFSKITFRFVAHPDILDDIANLDVSTIRITNIHTDANLFPAYDPSTKETTLAWRDHNDSYIKPYYDFQPNEFQLLLPQELGDDSELTLSYDLTLKSRDTAFTYDGSGNPVETSTYTYHRTATIVLNTLCITNTSTPLTEWLPNRHYIYTIRIGANRIEYTGQVASWGDEVAPPEIVLEEGS